MIRIHIKSFFCWLLNIFDLSSTKPNWLISRAMRKTRNDLRHRLFTQISVVLVLLVCLVIWIRITSKSRESGGVVYYRKWYSPFVKFDFLKRLCVFWEIFPNIYRKPEGITYYLRSFDPLDWRSNSPESSLASQQGPPPRFSRVARESCSFRFAWVAHGKSL